MNFVSEAEIEERKRRRQQEWDEKRKLDPSLPEKPPEAALAYDHRSLYERLEEQKQLKEREYEEKYKFKNMIAHIGEEDIDFISFIQDEERTKERLKQEELEREMEAFRNHVVRVDPLEALKTSVVPAAHKAPPHHTKKDLQKSILTRLSKKRTSKETEPRAEGKGDEHRSPDQPPPGKKHRREDAQDQDEKQQRGAEETRKEAERPADAPQGQAKPSLLALDYGSSDGEE